MRKARPAFDPGRDYTDRKRAAGKCICYRCDAPVGKHMPRCYKHTWQHKKRRDLIAYIFYQKRQRAYQRGKSQPWGNVPGWSAWTITLDNFRDWCLATGYHLKTGRQPASATIERRDNRFGYHVWNLGILSLAANSHKHNKVGRWEYDAASDKYNYIEDDAPPIDLPEQAPF